MSASAIERDLAALAAQNVSVVEADSNLSQFLTEAEFESRAALHAPVRPGGASARAQGGLVRFDARGPQRQGGSRREDRSRNAIPTGCSAGSTASPTSMSASRPERSGRCIGSSPAPRARGCRSTPATSMSFSIASSGSPAPASTASGSTCRCSANWARPGRMPDRLPPRSSSPIPGCRCRARSTGTIRSGADGSPGATARWRISCCGCVTPRARSPSGISIVVETVTLDYGLATLVGLDGSLLKDAPGIIQAWEVDAVSDQTAMREALPDDWISLIGMAKFARGASGGKPSWMFVYGDRPDDSLLVMADGAGRRQQSVRDQDPEDDGDGRGALSPSGLRVDQAARGAGCSPAGPAPRSRSISRPRAATISIARPEPASTP